MKILQTRNEAYGFYGTMRWFDFTDEAWKIAMYAIIAETGAEPDEVRDFLDSVWGRHFADTVHDFIGRLNPEQAIMAAIKRWNSWKLSPRIRRELNIPKPMPYLSGMIYAASI